MTDTQTTTKSPRKCEWADDDGIWNGGCGSAFVFNDGGPKDNGFKFCPYCGRRVIEGSYPADNAEEDEHVAA